MLEVSNLDAGYGSIEVLWDVDLRVDEREIVSLVGSNGAGKTTLLRAVSGVLRPSGSVQWKGRDIAGLTPEAIVDFGIAHVPEGRRLFAGLTVKENLLVGGYRRGRAAAGELDKVTSMFPQLRKRLGQVAGSLSGGEQQMCAIGRGLMSGPELLMIDELSLGLAPKLVDEILERLEEIRSEGTSILLIEQDVDAALRAADRGYVLETGRIVADGTGAELLSDGRIQEAYLGVT